MRDENPKPTGAETTTASPSALPRARKMGHRSWPQAWCWRWASDGRRGAFLLLAALVWCLFVPVGRAHPGVEQGVRRYERADLEGALRSFRRAEAASNLTLDELKTLMLTRALVHRALGNQEAYERDLRRLAGVDYHYRFDHTTPPDVVEAFGRLRGPEQVDIEVEVEARMAPTGVLLSTELSGDRFDVVRHVRLSARPAGGSWRTVRRSELRLSAEGPVEYFAEAVGPGGAVIATAGEREAPLVFGQPATRPASTVASSGDSDDGLLIGLGIGIGVAAAAAIAVLVAVLVAGNEDPLIQPSLPMQLEFPGP